MLLHFNHGSGQIRRLGWFGLLRTGNGRSDPA
jgi:hypothetical protein